MIGNGNYFRLQTAGGFLEIDSDSSVNGAKLVCNNQKSNSQAQQFAFIHQTWLLHRLYYMCVLTRLSSVSNEHLPKLVDLGETSRLL